MSTDSNQMGTGAGDFGEALQANWMPLSMIGIGLAWLVVSNSSLVDRSAKDQRAPVARGKTAEVADEAGILVRKEAGQVGQLVGPNGEPPVMRATLAIWPNAPAASSLN
jgi:hypothetical protein